MDLRHLRSRSTSSERSLSTSRSGPVLAPLGDDPSVSVVIPARRAGASLVTCLDAVLGQDPPPDEVVLAVPADHVDPFDDTIEVARRLAAASDRIRIVTTSTGRTPDALNAAIAASTGQVIARVDAHALLPDGYLAAAVAQLRASGAGNVGAVQRPVAERGFARAVAAAMGSPLGTGGAEYRAGQRAGEVDTAYLGVFRREALEAVGGYDPTFTRNQDAELNLRLRRAGYPVWLEPSLVVDYRPRGSVAGLARQYLGYGRWRRHTARTHQGSVQLRQLVPPAVVLTLLGAAMGSVLARDARPVGLVTGGYLGVVVGAGARAADGWRDAPGTASALATMHLSWGVGFLVGPPRRRP